MKESNVVKACVAISLKLLMLLIIGCAQKNVTGIKTEVPGVKSILIEQLKNRYSNKDWYVPMSIAIEGLTAEQANHKDRALPQRT